MVRKSHDDAERCKRHDVGQRTMVTGAVCARSWLKYETDSVRLMDAMSAQAARASPPCGLWHGGLANEHTGRGASTRNAHTSRLVDHDYSSKVAIGVLVGPLDVTRFWTCVRLACVIPALRRSQEMRCLD